MARNQHNRTMHMNEQQRLHNKNANNYQSFDEDEEDADQTQRKTKQARSRVLAKASEALAENRYESFALPTELKKLFQKPSDERSWPNAEALRDIVRRRAELEETLVL